MHYGESPAPDGHGEGAREERGLTTITFVGSFPTADFPCHSALLEVALVGRSNVGKSSLLNRLIGRRSLAHTSRTPGKTRACNVYDVDDRFRLVDLPGYGYARASKVERRGLSQLIRSYLSSRERLAGVIWLLDIRRDPSRDDLEMADLLVERGVPVLVAVTKADKVSRGRRRERVLAILDAIGVTDEQCVVTSATSREGVVDLRDSLEALVTASSSETGSEQ